MTNTLNKAQFKAELRRIYVEAVRNKWERRKLHTELNKLVKLYFNENNNIDELKSYFNNFSKNKLASFDWFKDNLSNKEYQLKYLDVLQNSVNYYARIGDRISTNVTNIVINGFKDDLPTNEIINELETRANMYDYQANTVLRTATAQLSSIQFQDVAINKAGIETFLYTGRPPQREFCQMYYMKVLTYEQIKQMSDFYGYDVFTWRGGWNCVHWWEAIIGDADSFETVDLNEFV